jgi:hypothetical protein
MKYIKTFESEYGNTRITNNLDKIKKEWQEKS